jgi:tetratricopeptide (TPR) repeat protein
VKAGKTGPAVDTYEKAANRYEENGFPNNAIALCNKVLRNAPGRTPVYFKLGKLMLERGFVSEAKRNLLEYAERMQKAGQLEQAFKALKEFADLSPDNEEIRLLLAEQLKAAARTDEAREQLAKLYAEVEAQGDARRTRSTLQKMQAIDPDYDAATAPKTKTTQRQKKTDDLVFLDLDAPAHAPEPEPAPEPVAEPPAESVVEATSLVEETPAPEGAGIEIEPTSLETETEEAIAEAPEQALDLEPTALETDAADADLEVERIAEQNLEPTEPVAALDGLDSEQEFEAPAGEVVPSLDIEPTAFDEPAVEVEEEAPPAVEEPAEEPVAAEAAPEPEAAELDEFEVEAPVASGGDASLELEVPDLDLESLGGEVAELDTGSVEIGEIPDIDLDEELTLEEPTAAPVEAAAAPEAPVAEEPAGEMLGGDLELIEEEPAAPEAPPMMDVPTLEGMVADDPENPELHRSLAEALLEAGERARGLEELEIVLKMHEATEAWRDADDVVGEILRLEPNSVKHHQKRVELSFHRGDKSGLANAYLGLADALLREGATDRARAVYQRVLEHDPSNERAQMGLETVAPEPEPAAPEAEAAAEPAPAAADSGDFVDLGSLILDDDDMRAMDTRMRIEEEEPTGDEEKDFKEMLSEFKRGIEANISEEDWQAHYDLGVAFKEMGLLDEAIGEFQKALRSPAGRLKTAEALGTCFYEKGQHSVAATVLRRAVESESGGDDDKIGLLYWLGRSEEAVGKNADALVHYQRVFAVDIGFEDISERVQQLAE